MNPPNYTDLETAATNGALTPDEIDRIHNVLATDATADRIRLIRILGRQTDPVSIDAITKWANQTEEPDTAIAALTTLADDFHQARQLRDTLLEILTTFRSELGPLRTTALDIAAAYLGSIETDDDTDLALVDRVLTYSLARTRAHLDEHPEDENTRRYPHLARLLGFTADEANRIPNRYVRYLSIGTSWRLDGYPRSGWLRGGHNIPTSLLDTAPNPPTEPD